MDPKERPADSSNGADPPSSPPDDSIFSELTGSPTPANISNVSYHQPESCFDLLNEHGKHAATILEDSFAKISFDPKLTGHFRHSTQSECDNEHPFPTCSSNADDVRESNSEFLSQSEVNNCDASARKRARTDDGPRERDWTCPSCGIINLSFRTKCNMRNCLQSRPAYLYTKFSPSRVPRAPPSNASSSAGGSVSCSVGSPYGPLQMSGPPYSSRSVMGAGGMPTPMVDGYDLGLMPMSTHGSLGTSGPGAFPGSSQKKTAGAGARCEDDWTCPTCGILNFAYRTVCKTRKCKTPRPGSQQGSKFDSSKGSN